jgi:hypothetical protein
MAGGESGSAGIPTMFRERSEGFPKAFRYFCVCVCVCVCQSRGVAHNCKILAMMTRSGTYGVDLLIPRDGIHGRVPALTWSM